LKHIKTPMSEGYHPEVDDTPMCMENDSSKYRSIIGCFILMIVLGRFGIAYATSVMSRFNMSPREGHLKADKRILAYLRDAFVYRYRRCLLLLVQLNTENNKIRIFNLFTHLITDSNVVHCTVPATNLDDTKTIFDNHAKNLVMVNICS
jgi:hypothetical protein